MSTHAEIIRQLNRQGWAISDTAVSRSWHISLLMHAWQLWHGGHFRDGQIGRAAAGGSRPEVRGDTICWVQPGSAVASHPFFQWMAQLRAELNRRYDLGLRSQEFHFARYAPGRGYKKHIDQHRGTNHRKVSIVLYLNLAWNPMNGGELCLYQPYDPDQELRRVAPLDARLAVFMSGVVPHAVLPARQTRWSLAGWLRTDAPAD